jgi:hypothetical protein
MDKYFVLHSIYGLPQAALVQQHSNLRKSSH